MGFQLSEVAAGNWKGSVYFASLFFVFLLFTGTLFHASAGSPLVRIRVRRVASVLEGGTVLPGSAGAPAPALDRASCRPFCGPPAFSRSRSLWWIPPRLAARSL